MTTAESSARKDGDGTCEACHRSFAYHLIHNGFNNTSYAYCASCGLTAFFDTLSSRPEARLLRNDRRIPPEVVAVIGPCRCGGRFDATSGPRCPHCWHELSPEAAASWLEQNAPANARPRRWWQPRPPWRWQRDWESLYAIVVEDRKVENPWRPRDDSGAAP